MHLIKIEKLRNNPILKAIFIIILLAFVWTFSEYNFMGNNDVIVKVGDKVITNKEFLPAYDRYIRSMSQEMQNMASDKTLSEAIKNYVLSQIITMKYQDIFIEKLGITISDKFAVNEIKKNEAFQEKNIFSQALFDQFLKSANKREKDFIQEVKESILRDYLASFMFQQFDPVSNLVAKELYPFFYQLIFFDMIKISPAKNLLLASEAEIDAFYKKNKVNYKTPASRKVRLIDISHLDSKSIENIKEEVYAGDNIEVIAKNNKLNITSSDLLENDTILQLSGQTDQIAKAVTDLVTKAEKNYPEIFWEEYGEKSQKKTAAFVFEVLEIIPSREQTLEEAKAKVIEDLNKEKEIKTTTDTAYMLFSSLSDKRDYPFLTNVLQEISKDQQLSLNDDSVINSKIPAEVREKITASNENKSITKVGNSFYLINIYKRIMPQEINTDKLKYLEITNKNTLRNALMQEVFNESKIDIKVSK